MADPHAIDRACSAIERGAAVVYPTETVYGLGADARSAAAVERVFELKRRDRTKPLSVAVHGIDALGDIAHPTDKTRAFMHAFLPGPITVVCERRDRLTDVLTAGHPRVGIRIPDHDLARDLLRRSGPLTATSANVSGGPSVTDVPDLDPRIHEGVAIVLDGGQTAGTPSTVVDVDRGIIHRRGASADAVEAWLEEAG